MIKVITIATILLLTCSAYAWLPNNEAAVAKSVNFPVDGSTYSDIVLPDGQHAFQNRELVSYEQFMVTRLNCEAGIVAGYVLEETTDGTGWSKAADVAVEINPGPCALLQTAIDSGEFDSVTLRYPDGERGVVVPKLFVSRVDTVDYFYDIDPQADSLRHLAHRSVPITTRVVGFEGARGMLRIVLPRKGH